MRAAWYTPAPRPRSRHASWRPCARSACRRAITSARARRSSCSTATISPPAPVPRALRPLPPHRDRRRPQPISWPRRLAWPSHARPTIASPACRPGGPPPRRSSMTPRRRCAAPKRESPVPPRGPCRPRRRSRAPGPPATRRAPPTRSPRSPRPSTAWSRRSWSSPETWRHQACRFSAWKTRADSGSRSAWTNRASARFDTATASRSSSGPGPPRSTARWSRSAGRWTPMHERFSSRSRCPMRPAFAPASSARRDSAGRRDAR